MNLSTTSVLLFLLSNVAADTSTLRGGQSDTASSNINDNQYHRELPPAWKTQGCKINGEKVGIYIGGGIGPSSEKWAQALASFWQTGNRGPPGSGSVDGLSNEDTKLNADRTTYSGDSSATYVTLTDREIDDCYNGELNALDLFIMPGGTAYGIQDTLGEEGKAAITAYLDQGGNYVGFCAGGYYMARGYYWKGEDGDPIDNCKNQFCYYGVEGTRSYDPATKDFTRVEWGGTSYHSNLLAYGPLSDVIVEGPIEEMAGPWDPPHYDSVLVEPKDTSDIPMLRQIYYGGSTEGYIYTEAGDWGSELAHFISEEGDLDYPHDSLWTLKETTTTSGGKIVISSAHIEASLFYTSIGDGGMTECQQYNNYAFMTRAISEVLGIVPPLYDMTCSTERKAGGEAKNTRDLYPGGLAYQNSPRIGGETTSTAGTTSSATTTSAATTTTDISTTDGTGATVTTVGTTAVTTTTTTKTTTSQAPDSPGVGGACGEAGLTELLLLDFEGNQFDIPTGVSLSGGAIRPWAVNTRGSCNGSSKGLTAGVDASGAKGVDSLSELTVIAPPGSTKMSYFYSYPSALDRGDDFHVIVDGTMVGQYETGPGVSCSSNCVDVNGGSVIKFICKAGGRNELCSIDQIRFQG